MSLMHRTDEDEFNYRQFINKQETGAVQQLCHIIHIRTSHIQLLVEVCHNKKFYIH